MKQIKWENVEEEIINTLLNKSPDKVSQFLLSNTWKDVIDNLYKIKQK